MVSNNFQDEILKIKKYYTLEKENFKILDSNECSIYWDRKNKRYRVEINRNQIDYFLIHEFGHVFLSKITQYPYFIKFTSGTEKFNQEISNFSSKNPMGDIEDLPKKLREFRIIHDYSNGILDCFVNYNTFIINDKYYNFYIKYIKEILNSVRMGFKLGKLRILLPSYINFYLEFKYIILSKDRNQNQKDLTNFIDGLKKVLVDSKLFNLTQFNSLDKILHNYSKVKTSNEHEVIINFIQEVLLNLNLWSDDSLKEKLAIIYPI